MNYVTQILFLKFPSDLYTKRIFFFFHSEDKNQVDFSEAYIFPKEKIQGNHFQDWAKPKASTFRDKVSKRGCRRQPLCQLDFVSKFFVFLLLLRVYLFLFGIQIKENFAIKLFSVALSSHLRKNIKPFSINSSLVAWIGRSPNRKNGVFPK